MHFAIAFLENKLPFVTTPITEMNGELALRLKDACEFAVAIVTKRAQKPTRTSVTVA
jgi:hypothetical protein